MRRPSLPKALSTKVLSTALAAVLGAGLLSACSSDDSGGDGPVELSFWSWVPNIDKAVDAWNAGHPDIKVTLSKQAGGTELVTKVLTANQAGNPPDLIQAEYQSIPTLLSNDVLADITEQAGGLKDQFSEGTWQMVTLGTESVYAVPQDTGPMMMYYRADLFEEYGLDVPETWEDYADAARKLRGETDEHYLTTFSANDPGWFTGLAMQAGASWWGISGDTWNVAINSEPTKQVAQYWNDMVDEGIVDDQPMYTPEWNKALNDGTLLTWPGAVWAPGVLETSAPDTKGKWEMAPLPQWTAGESKTGVWGGSSTAVTEKSKHKDAAVEFATWLNTDPAAIEHLVAGGGIYPAATAAQTGPSLQKPPAFFENQEDFYTIAAQIAGTASLATWGPNVNVTYDTYRDAFAKAVNDKTPFVGALDVMQQTTVDDMTKNGFTVTG